MENSETRKQISSQVATELRYYNKDKGWPLAHDAADLIEALEAENTALKERIKELIPLIPD